MFYAHTTSHEPDNQGRRYWDEESTPLFPFGHGLSYASFAYGDPVLDATSVGAEGTVRCRSTSRTPATGTPRRSSSSTCTSATAAASRPVRELKGFERVAIGAGQTRTVTFGVGPEHRRYWNAVERAGCSTPRRSTCGSAAARRRTGRRRSR